MTENRLREIRQRKRKTQREIGAAVGASQQAIAQFEKGKVDPSMKTLEALADALDCTLDELFGRPSPLRKTISIPIYLSLARANGLNDDPDSWEEIFVDGLAHGDYFYVTADDSSMSKRMIFPGSRMLVRRQSEIQDGEVALLAARGETMVRRVKYIDGKVLLFSTEPQIEPMMIDREEVAFFGKVVRTEYWFERRDES